uniref:FYVE-type domain-containing protein n=1 Tax=Manihot esculenta TaxID=3983 RepID=A0A2C9WM48_MANES
MQTMAITALKKGSYLLKYGRRGKPKFCPFQLSNDESVLIWYSGKEEKQLKLSQVSKIIPGQRTAIFQRYPRPEKEYQSFSLIYNDRSLDLICKDKNEADVWFVGLKALISRGNCHRKWRIKTRSEITPPDSPHARIRKHSPSFSPFLCDPGQGDGHGSQVPVDSTPQNRLGKAFSDIMSYTAVPKSPSQADLTSPFSSLTAACVDNSSGRTSAADAVRESLSSAVSSSSQGSYHEDFDALGDVFLWGEGIGDGILGGGMDRTGYSSSSKIDLLLPKALESKVVLDVHNIACGGRHAVLVTKQGEIFSWGEESGGRLGHGVETDVPHPKLVDTLAGVNIELVACGEHHTCAVTLSGDLYTWGDGAYNCGLLGHGSEASQWLPKKICGDIEGLHVLYISCGPWHTAVVTSGGQLFTFGDGTFGSLGHGDRSSTSIPREVEALRGLRTTRVACGVWHTGAVVEAMTESASPRATSSSSLGKLFTWGDGDKGRLGHGDKESRLIPVCVDVLGDENICRVACGPNITVALTAAGRVYTMGSASYGQLGNPTAAGKVPTIVEGKIAGSFVEEIACGSYHVAVLTSKAEVYTWGKGTNGQLGHGDNEDRNTPTHVEFLKDKQVKTIACGSNFTAIICLHKWVSSTDHSVCSGCRNPFGFRRKRHNCYNCGLVFCKACSSRKSLKASLAPNMNKPHRVCDDCFNKLKRAADLGSVAKVPKARVGIMNHKTNDSADREVFGPRSLAQLSRLSSAESVGQAESWHCRRGRLSESDSSRIFPVLNGTWQWGGLYSSKVSTFPGGTPKKIFQNSAPVSTTASLATPPLPGRISPPRSSFDNSKYMNDSLIDEITSLRAQVEDLTSKSSRLDAELQRKSKQLKEVAAIAADEAEKRKSAKEVIKSLTAQLKHMAEKRNSSPISSSIDKKTSIAQSIPSSERRSSSELCREIESNGNAVDNQMLSYRAKAQTEQPQWVVQAEPGVYMALSSLPGGGNELKRIRFSRKHFTEQAAEKWWGENGSRVCERHNIVISD